MKSILLFIVILVLVPFCGYSCNDLGYTTWTLEKSQFYSSDSTPSPEDPQYTFEYPNSFMEYYPSRFTRAPYNILLTKKYLGVNSYDELVEKKDKASEKEWEEVVEWCEAHFEVFLNSDSSWEPFELAPLEFPDVSENESSQVLDVSQVIIDGVTAERTTKRYFTKAVLYDAEYWRIFDRTVFEHDGYTWYIVMDAPWNKKDIMTEHYNHMLETFNILD